MFRQRQTLLLCCLLLHLVVVGRTDIKRHKGFKVTTVRATFLLPGNCFYRHFSCHFFPSIISKNTESNSDNWTKRPATTFLSQSEWLSRPCRWPQYAINWFGVKQVRLINTATRLIKEVLRSFVSQDKDIIRALNIKYERCKQRNDDEAQNNWIFSVAEMRQN